MSLRVSERDLRVGGGLLQEHGVIAVHVELCVVVERAHDLRSVDGTDALDQIAAGALDVQQVRPRSWPSP
jgi:hypothetical protein